ncbi:hypothetical protein [Azospirillum sp. INR13]|uniref:hypothetical protein n=1 Tax=Azospirillum sp. INR13 TaxID=2596919 RepID=UPI0018926461|nr:hypothetical protein [Azospirillum sp. INR13]
MAADIMLHRSAALLSVFQGAVVLYDHRVPAHRSAVISIAREEILDLLGSLLKDFERLH